MCYCSQDASDCQGSQGWECKKSNELGGQELNFDVKTAAAYNGVDGDGQVLIIGECLLCCYCTIYVRVHIYFYLQNCPKEEPNNLG